METGTLNILLVGDAVGRPGRRAVTQIVSAWRRDGLADFVIANGENSAHGKGITRDSARELFNAGVDVLTMGNHTWDNKDIFGFIGNEPRLIRPLNFGSGPEIPGRGWGVYEVPGRPGVKVGVLNVMGLVHMAPLPASPFHAVDEAIPLMTLETPIIIVDLHAEATSEKIAMGWHLDGRVSCVFGTHTHVATADNRVLPGGTAYQTDLGMTGGHAGVIGVKKDAVLRKFLIPIPVRHEVEEEDIRLNGALVTVDVATGKALSIERVSEALEA